MPLLSFIIVCCQTHSVLTRNYGLSLTNTRQFSLNQIQVSLCKIVLFTAYHNYEDPGLSMTSSHWLVAVCTLFCTLDVITGFTDKSKSLFLHYTPFPAVCRSYYKIQSIKLSHGHQG